MDAAAGGPKPISVAIVGRPNVGKSTLFNRLIGDERSIVHDLPGTTRDTIDTLVETPEGPVRFVDTAGMRRRAKEAGGRRVLLAGAGPAGHRPRRPALLVIDAAEGVTRQDQRLAERVDAAGNPIVVVLNKWDLLDTEAKAQVRADVADRLGFLSYAPVLEVSAKTGRGVHRLYPALANAVDAYRRRVPTAALNRAMADAQAAQPAPQGPGALRHPGRHGPAYVHPLHLQGPTGQLYALPGALHPGAFRLRPDAAEAEGPAPGQLTGPGGPPRYRGDPWSAGATRHDQAGLVRDNYELSPVTRPSLFMARLTWVLAVSGLM